mgnify:CR=1 FL=1
MLSKLSNNSAKLLLPFVVKTPSLFVAQRKFQINLLSQIQLLTFLRSGMESVLSLWETWTTPDMPSLGWDNKLLILRWNLVMSAQFMSWLIESARTFRNFPNMLPWDHSASLLPLLGVTKSSVQDAIESIHQDSQQVSRPLPPEPKNRRPWVS